MEIRRVEELGCKGKNSVKSLLCGGSYGCWWESGTFLVEQCGKIPQGHRVRASYAYPSTLVGFYT